MSKRKTNGSQVLGSRRNAQQLWRKVSSASDQLSELIDGIACATVGGEETRKELDEVLTKLNESIYLLKATDKRESRKIREAEKVLDDLEGRP